MAYIRKYICRLPRFTSIWCGITLLIMLIITFICFISIHNTCCSEIVFSYLSPDLIRQYTSVNIRSTTTIWLVGLILFCWLGLWAYLSYFIFLFIRLIVDLIFSLLFWPHTKWINSYSRYMRVIERNYLPIKLLGFAVFLLFVTPILIDNKIYKLSPIEIIRLIIKILLFTVPFIYLSTWGFYFYVVKLKTRQGRQMVVKKLISLLLSPNSVRRRFKTVCDALVFFIILGWILIPGLFIILNISTETITEGCLGSSNYSSFVSNLQNNEAVVNLIKNRNIWKPRPINDIKNFCDSLKLKSSPDDAILLHKYFMSSLFFIFMLVSFLEVTIPVVVHAFRSTTAQRAFKLCLLTTVRAFVIWIFFQFVIKRLFFVTENGLLNRITWLGLLISFFFARDSVKYFWKEGEQSKNIKQDC